MITGSYICIQTNWQPIHFACAHGQKLVLHELIENYGVDPHTEDQVGCMVLVSLRQKQTWFIETPHLIYCRGIFQKPVYSDLLNLQPCKYLNSFFFFSFQDGGSPLHSAVSGDQQEMVELLIEKYKADPTAPATLVCLLPMSSYKI